MSTQINPRLVRVGDIVTTKLNPEADPGVVERVQIVLSLSNGSQEIYETGGDDLVTKHAQEDLSGLVAEVAEIDGEEVPE